jgi:hypothetical protein
MLEATAIGARQQLCKLHLTPTGIQGGYQVQDLRLF